MIYSTPDYKVERAKRRIASGDGYDDPHVLDEAVKRMIDDLPGYYATDEDALPESPNQPHGAGLKFPKARSRGVRERLSDLWFHVGWFWACLGDARNGRGSEEEHGW